ncbi:MAG TPA: glycosyltransferase [Thermoanaerobaculia bacterium]|nr:glycosyltransferase [Thermoanaerobaculia bacterium]
MKIAFVMPGVGIVGRGAEAFVVELCTELAARHGFEVTLFSRGPAPVPHRRIHALSRDTRWVNAAYSASRLGRKVFDTLFLDPLSLEWYTAALSALPSLWRGGYGAVVMEGGLVGAWGCRLLRRLKGVPFVDIAHGQDPKWEGAFARQKPDRVVAFTEAARRTILARAPRARVVVIPHGVDLDRFRPDVPPVPLDLPRPVVLCAGAVDAHKRMHLAVEAAARAGASLVILGEGPEGEAVDRLAAARLAGRYLRRTVPRAEMPGWYAAADCFTLPSRTESFGLTYLEALACGRPCVAPDDEVRREVIGEAGICCDVTDLDDYAGALAAALARDWGEVPRRRAERFPVAATIDAYAALFRELTHR